VWGGELTSHTCHMTFENLCLGCHTCHEEEDTCHLGGRAPLPRASISNTLEGLREIDCVLCVDHVERERKGGREGGTERGVFFLEDGRMGGRGPHWRDGLQG